MGKKKKKSFFHSLAVRNSNNDKRSTPASQYFPVRACVWHYIPQHGAHNNNNTLQHLSELQPTSANFINAHAPLL